MLAGEVIRNCKEDQGDDAGVDYVEFLGIAAYPLCKRDIDTTANDMYIAEREDSGRLQREGTYEHPLDKLVFHSMSIITGEYKHRTVGDSGMMSKAIKAVAIGGSICSVRDEKSYRAVQERIVMSNASILDHTPILDLKIANALR